MKIKIPAVLKKQTVTQAALIIAIISFISKFFGFLREVLVAKYFGATGQTDAFLVALIIPGLLLGLFSSGINTIIIPLYLEKKKLNEEKAILFTNSIFVIWGSIFIVLSILIFLFATNFIHIIAYGFKGETFNIAVKFTRYLIISGIFTVFTGLFTGLFHAEKQFFLPAFLTLIGNIALVLSIIFLNRSLGIHSWTLGQIFSSGIPFFFLFFILYHRFHLFHSLRMANIDWKEIRSFIILLLPLIVSNGLSLINQAADKMIASSLSPGSISSINFATRIWQLPINLLVFPAASALFPTFSELALNNTSKMDYLKKLNKSIVYILYLTIPLSAILFCFSKPIVRLFFERGAFDPHATYLTSFVLKMYVIGLFGHSISPFLIRTFFSFKDTNTPLIISIVCVALNIILNIILAKYLGAAGIALATSFVAMISIILYSLFIKKYMNFFNRELISNIIKIFLFSVPIIVISQLLLPLLNNSTSGNIFEFIVMSIKLSFFCLLSLLPYVILSQLYRLEPFLFFKSYISNIFIKLIRNK